MSKYFNGGGQAVAIVVSFHIAAINVHYMSTLIFIEEELFSKSDLLETTLVF